MDKLIQILEDAVPGVDFKNEKHLVTNGILNSLGIVSIVVAIQDEYEFEIDFDELEASRFESIDTIWELVRKYIEGKA